MEFITHLCDSRFDIFNVNQIKEPINKNNTKMKGWQSKTYDELKIHHNLTSTQWGLRMGTQTNGKCILSLDFDVFNKNAPPSFVCEKTEQLLDEYLTNCDNKNGLYSSSTNGNKNVLVDYTANLIIQNLVLQISKAKFTKNGLEVLLGGYQVIPPTQTICKKTQTIGQPRTFYEGSSFFYVLNENDNTYTFKFIEQLMTEYMNKNSKKKTTRREINNEIILTVQPINTNINELIKTDKYLDLLFNVIQNKKKDGQPVVDYNMWLQIAGILKASDYPKHIFETYTELYDKNEKTSITWDSLNKINNKQTIYGLQTIAKAVNPLLYIKWLVKNTTYLHLDTLKKGENDIAKFVSNFIHKKLIFCRNEWWQYNEISCLWKNVKEPLATVTNQIQEQIDEAVTCLQSMINKTSEEDDKYKLLKKQEKEYFDFRKNICHPSCIGQIVKYLKSYLCDDNFCDKLDDGYYKMVFHNGVVNLKTREFRQGLRQDDYVTKTIPFNYEIPTDEEIKYVRENLKKICNYNDAHLEYYLSALGYALTGDSSKEQYFWFLRGQKACNGKSIIFEVLESIMPNYVSKANSHVLDKKYDIKKEVATWRGLKILWVNELSTNPVNEELAKAISDGTSYKYDRLYSTEAVLMQIKFKLFVVSNYTLNIKADAGIKRRFTLEQFDAEFKDGLTIDNYEKCEFMKDKDFGIKLCGEYRNALLYLLFTYSKKYWNEKKLTHYPPEWKDEGDQAMEDNNKFEEWFYDNFDVVANGQTCKDDLNNYLINSSKFKDMSHKEIKDNLARCKIPHKYDSQLKVEKKKGFWLGFQPKKEEFDEEVRI